jgi:hypothetical protein
MTDHTPEGNGTEPPFKKVEDQAHFERAPAPREPARDTGDPNLAFETAPRTPLAPASTPDPRALNPSPLAPPPGPVPTLPSPSFEAVPKSPPSSAPPPKLPAFEAVPASLGGAQQRLSTATIGVRPEAADVAGPVSPGGSGWNIRPRDQPWMPKGKHAEAADEPGWQTRALPNANRDRSALMVPQAARTRSRSRRRLLGTVLVFILLAIVAFAGYEWFTGRSHPTHTISTPSAVGALTAIHTPATVAVTQQMQKVMQEHGATRVVSGVYGEGGRPTLVVLLAQGPNIETSTNQFFSDFTAGLKTQGVSVISGETLNTTTGGSHFMCSLAAGPPPLSALSLCGWDDGDTIGLVMDVSGQPLSATLSQAEAARSAGEH